MRTIELLKVWKLTIRGGIKGKDVDFHVLSGSKGYSDLKVVPLMKLWRHEGF